MLDKTKNNLSKKFNTFLKRLNLVQCVSFPTRISFNEDIRIESLIDLVISNAETTINEITFNQSDQMADHRDLIINLCLNIKFPKQTYSHTFRDKRKYSKNEFNQALVNAGITDTVITDDMNINVPLFNDCFNTVLDAMCPIKTVEFKHEFGVKSNPELDSVLLLKLKVNC